MRLGREDGFAVLTFALLVSAAMAGLFVFVSGKSDRLFDRYYISQGQAYAIDLAPKLALKIRWSYDIALADTVSPGICASYGGAVTSVGSVKLCLVGKKICVPHPQDAHDVCISADNATLIAGRSIESRNRTDALTASLSKLFIPSALAAPWSPPNPPAGETTNVISLVPTCLGGDCGATCSTAGSPGTADCVTFKFCSLTTTCKPGQMVWQTIALLK